MKHPFSQFPFESIGALAASMVEEVYARRAFTPSIVPPVNGLPATGRGEQGLCDFFTAIVQGSAGLASGGTMGHMDTAPHPAAAFTDALISAVNNNLLFREISPFASRVEEKLLSEVGVRLGLEENWQGTFVSGGSLANLTALFAATGGYEGVEQRGQCAFFLPPCAHVSIKKSLAVMGISNENIIVLPGDNQGRTNLSELETALKKSSARQKIIVGVLGSTVHGAVESISELDSIAHSCNAWLHVDAIHGGALAFSHRYRHCLKGLSGADSVVVGPQKWMYAPRLSSMIWIRGQARFDATLGVDLPYSATGEDHRGRWGLQGSRRADALTLWAVLNYVGTRALGDTIDHTITLCNTFNETLNKSDFLCPTHQPDLNLQCFRYRDSNAKAIASAHAALGKAGAPWVSLSQWEGEKLFRAVLLSPATEEAHLNCLIAALRRV